MLRTFSNEGPGHKATARDDTFSATDPDDDSEAPEPCAALAQEVELLRAEKAALRHTLDELENLLEQKMAAAQTTFAEQQIQEALLEEKSEEIKELHQKLLDHPTAENYRESGMGSREDELLALSRELEFERRQLRDDEEALTSQMREMEVQMSRERAELARQRHELQRLHSEIVHELDRASRHAALRERLQPLQRRHEEMLHREASRPPREVPARVEPPVVRPQPIAPPPPPAPAVVAPPPLVPAAIKPPEPPPPPTTPPDTAPLTELPAPSARPPAEDENDLLQRLFG